MIDRVHTKQNDELKKNEMKLKWIWRWKKKGKIHLDISNEMNEKSCWWWYLIVWLTLSFIILLYVCNLSMYRERDMWICVIYFRALDSQYSPLFQWSYFIYFFNLSHIIFYTHCCCGSSSSFYRLSILITFYAHLLIDIFIYFDEKL